MNYFTQAYEPYAYKSYATHYRAMKIPKGLLVNSLRECGLKAKIVKSENFPYDECTPFKMKNEPLNDLQKTVISEVLQYFENNEDKRAIISLKTGQGKTYVATNIIHKLKVKALIMVKSNELKKQWLESFATHTTCKNVMAVERVQDLVDLLEAKDTPDIIVCTHRSMSIFMNDLGSKKFGELLLNIGIGIKVFDEFDLENASMFAMDMASSIKYNLYLSATDYKSSRSDNLVFKRIFLNVFNIGKEFDPGIKRNALFILYKSNPSRQEYGKCMQYSPSGMTFSYPKYHEYIVNKLPIKDQLKELWDNFISKRYNEKLKTVFFIGRKTTAGIFKEKLADLFEIKANKIGILNSDTPKKEREEAKSKYLIVSTSNSLGRGIDLKGLDTVVDLETRNSRSATNQVIGRVSRKGMKNVGTYIQFVDMSFPTVARNYNSKMDKGFFEEFFSNIKVKDTINYKKGEE